MLIARHVHARSQFARGAVATSYTTWFSRGVSSYVRYFADQPIVLKAISTGLVGLDPQFKIDGGEIMRGKELLGEIEICSSGSDLFAEDLATKIGELSFDARFPTLLMGGVYATVLEHIRRDPLVVLRKRLSLSRVQKIVVVARRLIRPHFA